MKKLIINTTLAILIAFPGKAQQFTPQDSLALKIPQQDSYTTRGISSYVKAHFSSDSARIRALFVWVANNISYDVEKLRLGKISPERPTPDEVLKTRKAVCQGYAELLIELCNQCGIHSLLVPGYAKQHDGTIGRLSHAWVASELNNKWYLFDPTWSSGEVYNDRFTKRFSNRFYKVLPEEMIKDHMPFDPMYQFLNYPITSEEFYEGKAASTSTRQYFNYADTLKVHNSLPLIDQTKNTARRIQNNGVRNDAIRQMLEVQIKNQESLDSKDGLDAASKQFELAIALFNRYIENKNKRFLSMKDKEIQQMIDSVLQYIVVARSILASVVAKQDNQKKYLYDIKNALFQFSQRVDGENEFLKKYLQTDSASRKMQ